MFCGKCGAKNAKGAKFCEKCGEALEQEKPSNEAMANVKEGTKKVVNKVKDATGKITKVPKKFLIGGGIGLVGVIAIIIVAVVLLNNPVNKVTKALNNYVANGEKASLTEIKNALDGVDSKTGKEIKKEAGKILDNWINSFNKDYKSTKDLEKAYDNITDDLSALHKKLGSGRKAQYVLSDELYYEYKNKLDRLKNSKENYLYALDEDEDYAYDYYSEVIKEDSYYADAQKAMDNIVKEELVSYLEDANSFLAEDGASEEEKLNGYIGQLRYLNNHHYAGSHDITNKEEYTTLYDKASENIVSLTKSIAASKTKELDILGAIDLVEDSLYVLDSSSDAYSELSTLKENLEKQKPAELTDMYKVNDNDASDYSVSVDSYSNKISFPFKGEKTMITYRINNEYKTFRATIERGANWPSNYKGTLIIYGDDKELYRSPEINKTNEFDGNINIDVTGVNDLKIVLDTTSESSGWSYYYLELINPALYK